MQINIFTLCDNAQEYNGKLVIVGTFNQIVSERFPLVRPELAIVAAIRFDEEEKGDHSIEFSIKNENSGAYLLEPLNTKANNGAAKGKYSFANFVIKLNGLVIKEPGEYVTCLKVDEEVREIILRVDKQ